MGTSITPAELAGFSRERRPLQVFAEGGELVDLLVPAFEGGGWWGIVSHPKTGSVELVKRPWSAAGRIRVHGLRRRAPPIDLGVAHFRGVRGQFGVGDLALLEVLAICHWWKRPIRVTYQRGGELGRPARERAGRIVQCLGDRLLIRDEGKGGELRTLLLCRLESVACDGKTQTRPGWTGTEYAAGGAA